jgi:hypothetical protein
MIPVQFTKQRAAYLADCMGKGSPIEPASDGWTGNDLLALAGAALAGAMSHGPERWWLRENELSSMQLEHREHVIEMFEHDLHAAIAFYGQLFFMAIDGEWDQSLEPEVRCLVTQDGTLNKRMRPVSGFKKPQEMN